MDIHIPFVNGGRPCTVLNAGQDSQGKKGSGGIYICSHHHCAQWRGEGGGDGCDWPEPVLGAVAGCRFVVGIVGPMTLLVNAEDAGCPLDGFEDFTFEQVKSVTVLSR
jgi:hypothetical protein